MTNHPIRYFICATVVATTAILSGGHPAKGAVVSRTILKTFFEKGDVPTQEQFGNLIDSYIHQTDDNLTLIGIGATPDGSAAGSAIRVGGNVGINETLPLTFGGTWKSPQSPPLPLLRSTFAGTSGFLPLEYEGLDGLHFGFLQIDMGVDTGTPAGPPIYVTQWVWESFSNTTLTTFAVPEPTTVALLLVGLMPILGSRRKRHC